MNFLNQIIKKKIFDEIVTQIYIIEYQKCKLSHMYLLLFMTDDNCILNINKINDVVLICISKLTINSDKSLTVIVKKFMIHDLYNQKKDINTLCLILNNDDNLRKCKKKFSKKFVNVTVFFENSKYLIYYQSQNSSV